MNITIVGSGYVGLVTGACFAEVGHHVICVDNNKQKVAALQKGQIPIYEPGLENLIRHNVAAHRLRFTTSIRDGVENSEIICIAVPTPPEKDGSVNLDFIEQVAREIAEVIPGDRYRVIVDKSTVPVKTGEKVADTIHRYNKVNASFDVVSNPEFLREGSAIDDLMKPDRIVIGSNSDRALALMKKVYEPFLALKISYINAVSAICEASGADVERVADGIGADKRIGRQFLNTGLGYGGSCFPKDVAAFIATSEALGVPFTLLKEVERINQNQRARFLKKIKDKLWVLRGKKITVWGLAFKPDTDDIRSSVAIEVVRDLVAEGAIVSVYDPKGLENFTRTELGAKTLPFTDPLKAVRDADALVLATEWPEFREADFALAKELMHSPIIFDGRNHLDREMLVEMGFDYFGFGR